MKNFILRIILGAVTTIVFVAVFIVSQRQQWSFGVTLSVVIVLFISVNIAYIVLFYRNHQNSRKDE